MSTYCVSIKFLSALCDCNNEIARFQYIYTCKNRYETKNADETKETETDAFSNATGALDGFGEQDPFASNKAKEAFSAPAADPFESAFSAQPSNVSFHSINIKRIFILSFTSMVVNGMNKKNYRLVSRRILSLRSIVLM